ncbi:MAG: hypothetical protein Q8908_09045 [Bacteroidota bacterium]|nr:hypothetical protein [Bacteroidota bacterium]
MVKLTWADHLRMEAKRRKRSISQDQKDVEFYDTDLLQKTSSIKTSEVDRQKQENEHENRKDEVNKINHEFHEQFF